MATVDPRPLAADERDVLDLLLSVLYPGSAELRQQAASAVVVGRCDCGCPTFDVGLEASVPAAPLTHRTAPVELRVRPLADEPEGSIVLFLRDGLMESIEYIYYSDNPPKEWPDSSRLSVFDLSS
jgi:hypothetical protein